MPRFLFFTVFFLISWLPAQTDFKLFSNLDLLVNQSRLDLDDSDYRQLQIPCLNFELGLYSTPSISDFFSNTGNALIFNLNDYKMNMGDFSHHLIDVKNNLLMYIEKQDDNIYSFGLTHRLFGEFFFSKQFISLLIDGNSHYLNETIYLDNNYVRFYNYFSLFLGYSRLINDEFQLGGKLRLIKGHNSFGIDNENSSILFSEHFGTFQNPFSIHINSDFNAFINGNSSLFSNLGIALDFNFYKKINQINLYADILEFGFIYWKEDQSISKGDFYFDGINYSLDQTLSTEFNNLYDTITDIFSIEEQKDIQSIRLLPFSVNIGLNKLFSNELSQINFNYNLKKLYQGVLHTGTISYTQKIPEYGLGLTPAFSINKFNYTNVGLLLNKQWKGTLYTNFYLDNIFGFIIDNVMSSRLGLGLEIYILF